MKTVWVVEQGSYSDYRVVGVFSSEENAQIIADVLNDSKDGIYDKASIDEWALDPGVHNLRKGYHLYRVFMREDGTVERCERQETNSYTMKDGVRMWHRTRAPFYQGNPDAPDVVTATVWAKDDHHAIKITNEHRARLIATGEWEKE